LPNGLIIQWMIGATNSSGLVSQASPIAFPNNLLVAVAS
jgi:hypothetical protein